MKVNFILLFLFSCLFSLVTHAQSAVFFSTETGAYGFVYSSDSKADAENAAYNKCIDYGGTNPILIISTEHKGYGAIALGVDSNGHRAFGASVGWDTQDEANAEGWRACAQNGGLNISISNVWDDVGESIQEISPSPKQDSIQKQNPK